jgi:hypothetical protein
MVRVRKIILAVVLCTILLSSILTAIVQGNEEWNVTLVGNETKSIQSYRGKRDAVV